MLIALLIGIAGNSSDINMQLRNNVDWLVRPAEVHARNLVMLHPTKRAFSPSPGIGGCVKDPATFQQALGEWEQSIYETISGDWQCKPVYYFMRGVQIVSYPPLDVLSPLGLYLADEKDVAQTGIAGFIGDCATVLPLKFLINRSRPVGETRRIDSSFPSGHTAFAFTQAVVYSHHNTKLRIPLYLYAAVVGISRVYLKKHYPTDVIGGALLGMLVGFLAVKITE